MQKVWITGAAGQIGTAINDVLDPLSMEILNTDLDELDITQTDEVLNFGAVNRPNIIINCAAITDVALCEKEPELAFRVNALGARNLSIAAQKAGAKMVQLSTDDVFDGLSTRPYTEFDTANPLTIYGRSKLAGENYVKEFTRKHFIIRSSWIFGKGDNFVNHILEAARTGAPLEAAADQTGSPTSAKDLARLICYLITTNEYGTYHATCRGTCSRLEFAREILRLTGNPSSIKAVEASQTSLSSVRPNYSVLDNFILRIIDVYDMPAWQDSLAEYIRGLS